MAHDTLPRQRPDTAPALVFSIAFISYSRNTGDSVAGLLGIPVYLSRRHRMTEPRRL